MVCVIDQERQRDTEKERGRGTDARRGTLFRENQTIRHRLVCSSAVLQTSRQEGPEREALPSRLLLISRRMCRQVSPDPSGCRKKKEQKEDGVEGLHPFVSGCVRIHSGGMSRKRLLVFSETASNNTANRLPVHAVGLRSQRALWSPSAAPVGLQHSQPKCQGYPLDFLTDCLIACLVSPDIYRSCCFLFNDIKPRFTSNSSTVPYRADKLIFE